MLKEVIPDSINIWGNNYNNQVNGKRKKNVWQVTKTDKTFRMLKKQQLPLGAINKCNILLEINCLQAYKGLNFQHDRKNLNEENGKKVWNEQNNSCLTKLVCVYVCQRKMTKN